MKRFAMMALMGMILMRSITNSANAATIRVPGDYSTIQAGVDAAINGDTVLVADGVYCGTGNYDIQLQDIIITLQSENGYEACVIDCQENGSGIFVGYPGSLIRGFTIKNSLDEWYNGGIVGYNGGTVADCLITNNWIGVYSSDCETGCTLDNCIIQENCTGIYTCWSYVEASNSIIRGNTTATYSDVMSGIGCFNCYLDSEIFTYYCGDIYLHNCTIQATIGGYVESYIFLRNCILWPGYIYGASDTYYNITYSNIQGGFTGPGNIAQDPKFVAGPLGNVYLSSLATGQSEDSPCINAGNDLAENVCDPFQNNPICMNFLTTSTDLSPDTGIVDMGYHYPSMEVTPTPCMTNTPTPTPVNTSEPTSTPEATDTQVPTGTPNHDGVDLVLNQEVFNAGDTFKLRADCSGPNGLEVDLYIILDVMGLFWFYPEWSESPSCNTFTLLDQQSNYIFIMDFTWPSGNLGDADGIRFWGALCYAGTTGIVGDYDCVTFGWQ